MLKIYDNLNTEIEYDFRLSNIKFDNQWIFSLNSVDQPHFNLEFKVPYTQNSFHDGYSTSVFLLKNKYFAQKDVIEVRVNESIGDNGRIGYILQLNSIFDPKVLNINKHLFSFIYYSLGNIFYNLDFKQTRKPTFAKTIFDISDFFDDDILLLIICDQVVAKIPNFKIFDYLPALYKRGFYIHDLNKNSQFYNESLKVKDNYDELENSKNRYNYYSLKLEKISSDLTNDDYILALFQTQLLRKADAETRFLILYQIVEILISKILTFELNKKVCNAVVPILSIDLKNLLAELSKESKRIALLMSTQYTTLSADISNALKSEIYSILNDIDIPEYSLPYDPGKTVFHDLFYDYRNKLLHSHRSFKSLLLNEVKINDQMRSINSLTELVVIDILTTFKSV